MANASVICIDKTGTLTQNGMTVVAGSVGVHAKFVRRLDENSSRAGIEDSGRPNARDLTAFEDRTTIFRRLSMLSCGAVA
jgi:Ca2+-transporting ATPase